MPLTLAQVPLDDLRSNERNPKRHELDAIAQSIRRFGFADPVVVDERTGKLAGGHGRVAALRRMRDAGEDPPDGIRRRQGSWLVPTVRGWSSADDAEAAAALIALNRTSEVGGWELRELTDLLGSLPSLTGTGYDDSDLADLRKRLAELDTPAPNADYDADPGLPAEPVSALGDVWTAGDHRIACGDALDADLRDRLLDGRKLAALFTDPPYGMNLETDYRKMGKMGRRVKGGRTVQAHTYPPVAGDDRPFDPRPLLAAWKAPEQFLFGGDHFYDRLPGGGSWAVWDKRSAPAWDGDSAAHATVAPILGSHFEVLWSRKRHGRIMLRYLWLGFTAREQGEARTHPTQKPIALCADVLERWVPAGGLVADPYCGVGTIALAALRTGRPSVSVELAPAYVDVTLRRLTAAGLHCVRDRDGTVYEPPETP